MPAGRPKGAKNKNSKVAIAEAMASGDLPGEFLIKLMRGEPVAQFVTIGTERVAVVEPLPIEQRVTIAEGLMNYYHARLTPTAQLQPSGQPPTYHGEDEDDPPLGDDGFLDWESELQRNPDWREILIAESDRRPLGVIQIIDPAREESHYWGEIESDLRAIDILIGDEADFGRGYGTQMMRLALERCFADGAVHLDRIDGNASFALISGQQFLS
jgi:GNAT acetyltransferase-like protein